MKRRTLKSIILALVAFGSLQMTGISQTKKAFIKAAEEVAAKHDHYSELVYYKEVLEFDEDNLEYLHKAAEAARQINALTQAAKYYKRVVELEGTETYPLTNYHLASMQQQLGKYDTAYANYQIFLLEYDGMDARIKARAEKEMAACEWAQGMTTWAEYEVEHLSSSINTPYTEFGATPVGDSLYFSSLRFKNGKDENNPTRPISGILLSDNLGTGNKLDDQVNVDQRHTAHTAFNRGQTRMYFTLCEYGLPDSIRCDLYYRDKGDAGWGAPVALTSVNNPEYTSTQPNVGYNDETGKSYLYFASDRPGGKGGMDIYRMEITNNGFGSIENIDGVNTPYQEYTPFYHSNTKTLYFSSDGRKTLGGLDIFKTSMRTGAPGKVQHLGDSLNTSYHDLYFTLNDKGDVAYLSSNRAGSFQLDEEIEACCYDIYKVKISPFANLIAQTFDAATLDSLDGTLIRLINKTTGEEMSSTRADLASAKFPLSRDMEYCIIASKEGYIPDTVKFNTFDIVELEDIVKKLYLKTDILKLDVFTFDDRTKLALRGATVTLYDLDNPDAEPVIFTNFDANDFHYDLERGKRYRVTATRKGYKSETVVIDTNDHWDKSLIRQDLYLKIGDLEDFLPLVLYFDNDHPNPDTWLKETPLKYTETFPPYYARKDVFVDTYTAPLAGEEKSQASRQLYSFFDTEVKKGNDDLLIFLEVLEAHLMDGDRVNISLKGYTSPRASQAYNFVLGQRRVSSVENNFEEYAGGKLKSFLTSGQLTIGQKSFGETTAPKGISSSIKDERKSIYSYEASKERRVEIIQIDVITK
jgi:hypothetical protein